jgi:hypothetical protein
MDSVAKHDSRGILGNVLLLSKQIMFLDLKLESVFLYLCVVAIE